MTLQVRDDSLLIDGLRVPRFLYGTAWKEEATQSLVELAITQGFRGIDTANQRRHYHEAAVGQGIAAAVKRGIVARENLFVQTKFTFQRGQDHRLPYDPRSPVAMQVDQSLASSLEHLQTETIDSFVLHGPSQSVGLGTADIAAWKAMEAAHNRGHVRLLGVSNVDAQQLRQLCDIARTRPHFVQNRCFAETAWDRSIRECCAAHQIVYQGFSLLTANKPVLVHPELRQIARQYDRTPQQIIFRFALEIGMIALTGTSDQQHMQEDLAVSDFQLKPAEVTRIEGLIAR